MEEEAVQEVAQEVAPPTLAALVKWYLAAREQKTALKKKFDEDTAALDDGMTKAEAFFAARMQQLGLESLPTPFGVPYRSTRQSFTVSSRPEFEGFMRETGLWELADIRASKKAIEAYIEETSDIPPGLSRFAETVINVRKK